MFYKAPFQVMTSTSALQFKKNNKHCSQYIWIIDHMQGQDGWILSKFFFYVLWTKMESRSIN